VDLRDVPHDVRRTLEDQTDTRKITELDHVRHGDREFYRAIVKIHGGVRDIRVAADGRLINVDDIHGDRPSDWHDYESHATSREDYWTRMNDRVTATVDHPEWVKLDECPPRARATFEREAMGAPVDKIVRYRTRDGHVVYQANVPNGHRTQVIQVLWNGELYGETNVGGGPEDRHITVISYDDLPGSVHDELDRDSHHGRDVTRVVQQRVGDHKVYTVTIDNGHEARYVTIGERGHILHDFTDHYGDRH
jgi:hypothetical protein